VPGLVVAEGCGGSGDRSPAPLRQASPMADPAKRRESYAEYLAFEASSAGKARAVVNRVAIVEVLSDPTAGSPTAATNSPTTGRAAICLDRFRATPPTIPHGHCNLTRGGLQKVPYRVIGARRRIASIQGTKRRRRAPWVRQESACYDRRMQSTARPIAYRADRPFRLLRVCEDVASHPEAPGLPEPETASDWAGVHERLLCLAKQRAANERDVCRWLLAAARLGVHARAGHASLREYADRVLGLNARQTEERLRVGRALTALPVLDAALASGELAWSAVREITRVATPQSEGAWVAWARSRRVHEIETAVTARKPGDSPDDRADPSRLKHRLVFEVRAETMALFRDLQAAVRADLGGDVDDDAMLYELARRALGGPTDEGRASYQVLVTRCDGCGLASIDAGGTSHVVDRLFAETAACDAQELAGAGEGERGSPHVGARPATQAIPPATRRAVMRRDHRRCVVPGCTNHRFLDVHHLDPRSEGGGHAPDRLAVLCGAHHRAVHAGALRIAGGGASGLAFHHADGTAYGGRPSMHAADVVRRVLGTLEHMGFKPTRARALVDAALQAVAPEDTASLLSAALRAS
jgi:hypothetical protein